MINPLDLQNNILTIIRDIPELVALVGDMAYIQAYDDESQINGDPENAELSLMGKSVLVIWTGAELPREGEMRGWTHNFRIAIKAESIMTCFSIAQTIIDGVPRIVQVTYPDPPDPLPEDPNDPYYDTAYTPIYTDGVKVLPITEFFDDAEGGPYDGVTSFLNSVIHPECDGIQNVELTPNNTAGIFFIDFTITERA